MKVTLDLTRLLQEGEISEAEFARLQSLAARDTGSLAINILIGFGVVAVAAGALALVPTPLTATLLGAIALLVGLTILFAAREQWGLLANVCILVGALLSGGGIVKLGEGSVTAFSLVAALFAGAGLFARSGLLIVASVLALSSCLGARTGYLHATYFLGIQEPALTIVVFGLLGLICYEVSRRLRAPYEGLAIAATRTCVFLVNFGFWIGSLWGDRLVWLRKWSDPTVGDFTTSRIIQPGHFAIAWALALAAAALWGMARNRRWLVNVAGVFAAIHFYTQWFERLGATPGSILIAGLLVLAFAFGLWQFNRRLQPRPGA